MTRNPSSWQLILADLALILFLVTAAALTAGSPPDEAAKVEGRADAAPQAQPLAPSQALFRAGPGLPTLAQWLALQPRDPRAALTIIAQYAPGEEAQVWDDARQMAATAAAQNVRARVVIRPAQRNDLYASLAFDQPQIIAEN